MVLGFRFRAWGLGFTVSGLGFRALGLGFRVWGFWQSTGLGFKGLALPLVGSKKIYG